MGYDYWLVHLTWTIPPAALFTVGYWPFFTRLEIWKIVILINVAVYATIPWDSFLIRNRIWTYPADAVVGWTLFEIPIEELFFFVIQTYCTSLLYTILTKHLVLPSFLLDRSKPGAKNVGAAVIIAGIGFGAVCIMMQSNLTYMGLILTWALSVILFQWCLCGSFLLSFPKRQILMSVLIPTAYLWMVDRLSLQRGTWVIEKGTKLDIQFWGFLDIEEATFFLLSNVMVVFGMVTMDHAIALAQYDVVTSDSPGRSLPSLGKMAYSYMAQQRKPLDEGFLDGLCAAVTELSRKSQSMYLGSAMFQDGLRVDLIFLYSFCRVIDDLVDEAPSREKAQESIKEASQVLHWRFSEKSPKKPLYDYLQADMDRKQALQASPLLHSIALLPASRLSLGPLLELLSGFDMDLGFSFEKREFPIETEDDLEVYAQRVAGTVAAGLLELVFSHTDVQYSAEKQEQIIDAGQRMGQALQYVNIARDIKRDAAIKRVYIPTAWLKTKNLTPVDVITNPDNPALASFEDQMLLKADQAYRMSVKAIDQLPKDVRGPIKTTIESYMMIGQMVRKARRESTKIEGKLKVPLWRRLKLAWTAMYVNH
ncbi:terpene cyclase [Penicillium ucsense]|uniref:Bifunctional lycopene cyclase/phytoene synthase n=1 Tax=Penicillium ucsense TaxID=2839758 RepID=A0A8J8WJ70_9EURO|nr:terpene cyclase [Penicillium ucsense]KAF7735828.1 terpene cyclase [Penicillium ucsense]